MALARWQHTVVDEEGNVQDQASVEVRSETSGAPLAILYSNRAGTIPLGNPFQTDATGFAAFHVVGGAYRITATKGAFSQDLRYVGVGLAQEADSVAMGVTFTFSASTVDSDPGTGGMRFNNATLASVTQIFLDNVTAQGTTISTWLDTWDDEGDSGDRGILTIMTNDAAGVMVARITGSVTDGTGYRKVVVTPISTSGTFQTGDTVNVQFNRSATDGIDAVQPGYVFRFDSATAMADPGTGDLRLNNATLSSVTAAAVDDLSALTGNPDVSAAVLSWDDSTNTANRGTLLIKKATAPQNFALYNITGASTDNSGWTQLALTYVAHAGSFSDTDLLVVEFTPSANAAATASESTEGLLDLATDAEIRSATTGSHALTAADLETAAAAVALTDAAPVAVDWDTGINFTVTVTANRAIGNPTNGQPGTFRTIMVQGNDATDRTITFGNQFLGEVPTITDCDSTRWYMLTIYCHTTTHFVVSSKKANGT